MRDHSRLKAFKLADELVVIIYDKVKSFPNEEKFGLAAQIKRAAVSVPANIVEGCARNTETDYLHFLDIAYGSARELEYLVSLSGKLDFISSNEIDNLSEYCAQLGRVLNALICSLRKRR